MATENHRYMITFFQQDAVFAEGISKSFDYESMCDMNIDVIDANKVLQQRFKAHRQIVAASSEYLAYEIDKVKFNHNTMTLTLEGVEPHIIGLLLEYIYHGSVNVNKADLCGLVDAAVFYDIDSDLKNLDATKEASKMVDGKTVEVVDENHGYNFVDAFKPLYAAKKYFDVTLLIERRRLGAHRVVLSAVSDYFAAIFERNVLGDHVGPVIVVLDELNTDRYDQKVTFVDVGHVLDYIYNGIVEVECVVGFQKAAQAMEIRSLLDHDHWATDARDAKTMGVTRAMACCQHTKRKDFVKTSRIARKKPGNVIRFDNPGRASSARQPNARNHRVKHVPAPSTPPRPQNQTRKAQSQPTRKNVKGNNPTADKEMVEISKEDYKEFMEFKKLRAEAAVQPAESPKPDENEYVTDETMASEDNAIQLAAAPLADDNEYVTDESMASEDDVSSNDSSDAWMDSGSEQGSDVDSDDGAYGGSGVSFKDTGNREEVVSTAKNGRSKKSSGRAANRKNRGGQVTSLEYTVQANFVEGRFGSNVLLHDEYRYSYNRPSGNGHRYKCTSGRCTAYAYVNNADPPMVAYPEPGKHSH